MTAEEKLKAKKFLKNKLKEISQKEGFQILDSEEGSEIHQDNEIMNLDLKETKKPNRKIIVDKVKSDKKKPNK